jgi:hypothetical protein
MFRRMSMRVRDALSKVYKLKGRTVKTPDVDLGAEVKQLKIPGV